jgi:hypothetical protein
MKIDHDLDWKLFEHYCRAREATEHEWQIRKPFESAIPYYGALDAERVARHYLNQYRGERVGAAYKMAHGYGEQGPQPRDFGRRDLLEILRVHAERQIEPYVSRKSKADDAAFACSLHYLEEMR